MHRKMDKSRELSGAIMFAFLRTEARARILMFRLILMLLPLAACTSVDPRLAEKTESSSSVPSPAIPAFDEAGQSADNAQPSRLDAKSVSIPGDFPLPMRRLMERSIPTVLNHEDIVVALVVSRVLYQIQRQHYERDTEEERSSSRPVWFLKVDNGDPSEQVLHFLTNVGFDVHPSSSWEILTVEGVPNQFFVGDIEKVDQSVWVLKWAWDGVLGGTAEIGLVGNVWILEDDRDVWTG